MPSLEKKKSPKASQQKQAKQLCCKEVPIIANQPYSCFSITSFMRVMNAQQQTSQWNLGGIITSCINFLQTGRISLASVALNIMTCFSCGVMRNTSCTSLRISERWNSRRLINPITNTIHLSPRPKAKCNKSKVELETTLISGLQEQGDLLGYQGVMVWEHLH